MCDLTEANSLKEQLLRPKSLKRYERLLVFQPISVVAISVPDERIHHQLTFY